MDDKAPVLNKDIEAKVFYQQLRDGANAKTAAMTPGYFAEHARESLEQGKDILYIGFTSGLSVTYNNGAMMLGELQEEYPERKLLSIDTWNYVFISHGDCLEDAQNVKAMVEDVYPQVKVILRDVGPVIGVHTGPGVIALCYLGKTQKGTR